MAFSDLGSLGATGSTANNQATLALTTAAAASAGELVVLVIADDNIGTADQDGQEVASVTDNSSGGPNSWNQAHGWTNGQGVAQGGAAVQIWYSVLTHAISNGGTITVTFSNATTSDATGLTARHFSFSGTQVAIENVNHLADDAADPSSLDATTGNIACLRIRGIAGEVGNDTSLTPTTNWTAWANGNSATSGTTAEMCARAEHHISTGTTDASNPTWVSCDSASVYVAFKEIGTGVCYINSGLIKLVSSTSITPVRPPLRNNGNLLLAFACIGGNTTASVSGTGWTLVESTNNGTITQAWAWCIVNGSEADPTFSWAGSASTNAIVLQYCNVNQSGPIGAHNVGLGSGTTISVSAITTTADNSAAITFLQDGLSTINIPPVPTNYSDRFNVFSITGAVTGNIRIAEETIATSGSSSDAVSVAISSANWRGWIIELLKTPAARVFPLSGALDRPFAMA